MVWMDQLRGIAILLVVLVHAAAIPGLAGVSMPTPLLVVLDFVAPFRMPMLVFLSGMLLSRSLSKPAGAFFRGKARAIAWPYVLWTAVYLVGTLTLTVATVLRALAVPPTYLWYLWFLLAYYTIAWIMKAIRVPLWVGIAIGFLGAFGPETFRIDRFFFLMTFFFLGHYFATRGWKKALDRRWGLSLAASSLLAISAGTASAAGVGVRYEPLFIWGPIAGIAALVLLLERGQSAVLLRPMAWIGRDSIVFYVLHYPVIMVTGALVALLGDVPGLVYFVAGLVTALAVGSLANLLAHRFAAVDALFRLPELRRRPSPSRA